MFLNQRKNLHIVGKLLRMSHWNFMSGNIVFQKLVKMHHFGIFYELLSTQNVNIARFARNVEWGFFL